MFPGTSTMNQLDRIVEVILHMIGFVYNIIYVYMI